MTNNIAVEQNKEKYIERLAAQRRLYSIAKNIFAAQFILGLLVVLLGYISAVYTQLIVGVNFVAVVSAFMVSTVMLESVKNYKKKAASIQELIDCDLLRIQWNKELVLKPDLEDIKKYSKKLLNNEKARIKLIDWYEGVPDDLSFAAARIICQRSNVMWDFELRVAFSNSIKVVSFVIVFSLFLFWAYQGYSVVSIFMSVVLPSMAIIVFAKVQHNANKESIEEMVEMKVFVMSLWDELLSFNFSDDELVLRSRRIQDMIYLYRKSNPLIPDWYAEIKKKNLQSTANRTVSQLVKEYKDALEKRMV